MYRIGVLVKYSPFGSLLYLGRVDLQTKINGQRIQLEEVERAVQRELFDKIAVVDTLRLVGSEIKILCLFVVVLADPPPGTPDDSAVVADSSAIQYIAVVLRGVDIRLSRMLLSYMIPSHFVPIRKLPLTTSGKLNRKALTTEAESLKRPQLGSFADSYSV